MTVTAITHIRWHASKICWMCSIRFSNQVNCLCLPFNATALVHIGRLSSISKLEREKSASHRQCYCLLKQPVKSLSSKHTLINNWPNWWQAKFCRVKLLFDAYFMQRYTTPTFLLCFFLFRIVEYFCFGRKIPILFLLFVGVALPSIARMTWYCVNLLNVCKSAKQSFFSSSFSQYHISICFVAVSFCFNFNFFFLFWFFFCI